jgi:hypothetical protein
MDFENNYPEKTLFEDKVKERKGAFSDRSGIK